MTKQESFKRRVRARMEKTGERYGAARRALIAERPTGRSREWASEPEHGDDAIRAATGRGWDEWCDVIEAWPGHVEGHTAIAAHVHETSDLTHWWSQAVTVGYERIVGIRVPYQRSDGSFAANRARTLTVDVAELRAMLLDDDARTDLFPGYETTLRSKPTTKALRIEIGPGIAIFELQQLADGRAKVAVSHEQLTTLAEVEEWRHWWADWLDAIDDPAT